MAILPEDVIVITIRVIVAAILCGLIGLEREIKGHPAGFRTHLLVGIGSCMLMILALYGFDTFLATHDTPQVRMDPSRIASYVISGIGFLGAGTIIVQGVSVKGLTTAASIWVVAGIGLVVGDGMYYIALLTTFIVILSLLFLNKFESVFINATKKELLNVVVINKTISLTEAVHIIESHHIKVEDALVDDYFYGTDKNLIKYTLKVKFPKKSNFAKIYDELNQVDDFYKIYATEK